jgi:Holliday junction resolvasome, endonuclease subunit
MEIIALGIDQGLANLGFGIINLSLDDNDVENDIKLIESGTYNTSSKNELQDRLLEIHDMINGLNLKYNANVVGCEKLFFNPFQKGGRNKSASIMITNMVSGIIFLVAGENKLFIKDFTPGTVKKYVAGSGRATKDEVIKAIDDFCTKQGVTLETDHEADAISIGITVARYYVNDVLPIIRATEAVIKAETSMEEKDLISATTMVNSLPLSNEKTDLLKRIGSSYDIVVTNAVVEAETSKTEEDIARAVELINALSNGRKKTSLSKRIDKVNKVKIETVATNSVIEAEISKTNIDIARATELINSLPSGRKKTSLSKRVDKIKN